LALISEAKAAKKYRKALAELSASVTGCLNAIDAEMKKREGVERGRRIAQICNALDMANDHVRYFVLGVDYRTDKK
jgi:hypothetical protein